MHCSHDSEHSHHHGHAHGHHGHAHGRTRSKSRLKLTLALAAVYMVAEAVGGWWTNSLALVADAGHMLSDVAALGLSLFASWISTRPSPTRSTYGYYRAEILAALVNGAALIAVSLWIFVEAWQRLREPEDVQGPVMLTIAVGGLAVNVASLWILHDSRNESLNVRGAWLHVLFDALGSVAAIVVGFVIWQFGWRWADPIASALIAMLVIYSSWRLLAEAVSVLMESAPAGIDVDQIDAAMRGVPGVGGVHDLHVWTITSGLEALSAHVVIDEGRVHGDLLKELREMLHDRFGIDHITIQLEPADFEERPVAI